ncbi:hypothetical protein [Brevundimonas variabilis]|uniref:Uncharacterized protein n=1 Tax=Brevundimonas variabilis TaxID=74312 RepID=A0A7W9CJI4_9CAUL|nr:hypothetical protein [Brevundimonas variabilis]MBB5746583.1 hypothetical protein [Brevundimonas variabilis]
MAVQVLKRGDGRRRGLIADWDLWLHHADELYLRFVERVGESPFSYHEVACTGFLASAAAMAGFIPLAEYEIIKRAKADRRTKADGRADLWFASPERAYSFEVKRAWLAATPGNLKERLAAAADDIACIPRDEYHHAAGLLIAKVRDVHRQYTYEMVAQDGDVDLAYRIGPEGEEGAYLYFKLTC